MGFPSGKSGGGRDSNLAACDRVCVISTLQLLQGLLVNVLVPWSLRLAFGSHIHAQHFNDPEAGNLRISSSRADVPPTGQATLCRPLPPALSPFQAPSSVWDLLPLWHCSSPPQPEDVRSTIKS